ncbi:hypothetical protein PssB301D_03820 [Pseudomonas syringae pv. syringae str. B301D-R]|nr:hypothetical protein PsyrB_23765 [Pseudomonas syringae pv. syringae B301D]EXL29965.1 hypothetical protein PssB301D_03820 [Pseudomonas syringae pv. syringae str. B301D-R]SOP95613.1 hypothetical protein CFBP2118_00558 [Pseudomonas syringae pv. syringae]
MEKGITKSKAYRYGTGRAGKEIVRRANANGREP